MRILACVILFCVAIPTFAQNKLVHDFRGSKFDKAVVQFCGPKDKTYMIPEKEGLRFRYTGKDAAPANNPAGICSTAKARGDFVVTARYELLKVGMPAKGTNGIGVELYLVLENPNRDGVALSRTMNLGRGAVHYFNVRTNDAAGKRFSKDSKGIDTTDRSLKGQLRLAREGTFVIGSFAEGDDGAFQEIQRSEVGNADVGLIRFNGHSGDDKNAILDMRILEFNVEGQDLSRDGQFATVLPKGDVAAKGDAIPADQEIALTVPVEDVPSSKRSLLLLGAVALMLAIPLILIVAVIIFLRLRKTNKENEQD